MGLMLQPNQKQIEDLCLLCSSPDLNDVANKIVKSDDTVLSPSDAKKKLAVVADKLSEELQASLFRQVMGLRSLIMRGDFKAQDVMLALDAALEKNSEFSEHIELWKTNVREPLQKILESRFIRIVSKSANLAYDYAYLLRRARIITDARPVFSEEDGDVNGIDGVVVSHVLRLEYENSGNQENMSIVMDHLDVKNLRETCDRAVQKAEAAEKSFAKVGIPTKVTGKDDD
jgi:hypothetical protein